jgi:hypothetical protein
VVDALKLPSFGTGFREPDDVTKEILMPKTPAYMSKRFIAVAAASMALAVTLAPRPVFAASGLVSQVEYNVSAHILALELNHSTATLYLAQITTPGCGLTALTADEVKMILSIAQASYLSGRNVSIGTATCGSSTYITDIALQ